SLEPVVLPAALPKTSSDAPGARPRPGAWPEVREIHEILRIDPQSDRAGEFDYSAQVRNHADERPRAAVPIHVAPVVGTAANNGTQSTAHVEHSAYRLDGHSQECLGAHGQHVSRVYCRE